MSLADLRRCALAYGWKLQTGCWQERLVQHVHYNKILHVFRHAVVKRDPRTTKPIALWFAEPCHARSAKDDMHHVDKVFGIHMALLCGAHSKHATYSPEEFTPAPAAKMSADECLRAPRAAGDVAVTPVNDSRRQLKVIDETEIARATSRLKGWRGSRFNSGNAPQTAGDDNG